MSRTYLWYIYDNSRQGMDIPTVSIYRCLVLRRMVVSCEVRTRQEQEL